MPTSDPTPGWGPPEQVRICDLTDDHEVLVNGTINPWIPYTAALTLRKADQSTVLVTARLPEPPEAPDLAIANPAVGAGRVKPLGEVAYATKAPAPPSPKRCKARNKDGLRCGCTNPTCQWCQLPDKDEHWFRNEEGLVETFTGDYRLARKCKPGDVLADGRVVMVRRIDLFAANAASLVRLEFEGDDGDSEDFEWDARVPLAPKDQP